MANFKDLFPILRKNYQTTYRERAMLAGDQGVAGNVHSFMQVCESGLINYYLEELEANPMFKIPDEVIAENANNVLSKQEKQFLIDHYLNP